MACVATQLICRARGSAVGAEAAGRVCEDADVYQQRRLTTPESDMSTIHHDITTPAPPQLQEVDDGVFAYIQPDGTWWINNTGFLVGQRGVISIDTCATVRRTRAYLDAIRTVTPQPVRTVINTVDRRALRASSPPANL